ncbi:M-phase phosphoprotein 8-like [Montipora capricornis]|uniref:M-phase phosphoprotein 8-like n=1 Tax=Montipora capricornis TaxID=246305 RepID=UPI0035F13C7D
MVKNDDGTCSLSEDSKANLQSKEKATPPTIPIVEDRNQDDDYYEVEKVLEVRLNKQFHSEECRVRFKGYTSEDDMWLPSFAFKEPVTFNTVSKRGRIRKHTMKDDSAPLDIPRRKREPLTEKTSLKRKHFRGPAAGGKCEEQKKNRMKVDSSQDDNINSKKAYKRKKSQQGVSKDKQCKKPRRSRDGRYFRRTLGQRTENEEVSLSSEDEEISKDEEVFKNAYKKQLVVQASSHQGDNSLVFHHAGQQCAGIAFISLLYSTIHPVGTWREQDLDKLLIAGDRLHFFQVCCLRYKVAVNQKLHVDELPNKLRAFGYDFHVDTEIVGGTTMQEREDEDVLELQQVLEKSVQQNSFGFVLRFEDYCVACINSYG